MITPHVLTRIEQYTGIATPTTSTKGISLIKQVKIYLFNRMQYAKLLNTEEFYVNRFIVSNVVSSILENPFVKNMRSGNHIENAYQHWTESRYDLECSCKVDYMNNTGIIDIRLTSCATLSEFITQCHAYKYNRHAAFVSDGLNKSNYIVVGVNKKKFNTFTVNLSMTGLIQEGRTEYEEIIDKFLCLDEVQRDSILETTF